MIIIVAFHRLLDFTIAKALITGALIGILGQAGDLLESVAKRVSHTKDSSAFIPGHGGVLDRIDSFIFTAPFWYFCIIWV
jgi:phosphatidate cytidylyltransferase